MKEGPDGRRAMDCRIVAFLLVKPEYSSTVVV
jgi:hypothetical protein